MATSNIDLLSVLPGIEVTQAELLEAELLSYQILSAKYPTLDLREGTGLRDTVIRPGATLLAMINKALVFYFSQNTLSNVDDVTPQVFVDSIMSNWFLTRKSGTKAVISAKLFFAKSKSITLYSDSYFSVDGVIKFYPLTPTSYSSSDLQLDQSGQYYIDVDLIAEAVGDQYNVGSGSLVYFSNFDPYFLHGEINYLSIIAGNVETNTEFLARAEKSISTRNLINSPSISSNIRDTFSVVSEVYSAGFGSPEMIRDQLQVITPMSADPIWIHNGGCVDVYCRIPLETKLVQLITDSFGRVTYTGDCYNAYRWPSSLGPLPETVETGIPIYTIYTKYTNVHAYQYIINSTPNVSPLGSSDIVEFGASPIYSLTLKKFINHGLSVGERLEIFLGNVQVDGSVTVSNSGSEIPTLDDAQGLIYVRTSPDLFYAKVAQVLSRDSIKVEVMPSSVHSLSTPLSERHGTTNYPASFISGLTLSGKAIVINSVDRYSDFGFSPKQETTFDFGVGFANRLVSFAIQSFTSLGAISGVDGINSYLQDQTNRVIAGDYLPRGFNISSLSINVVGLFSLPDQVICTRVATEYVTSLTAGQSFIMSDFLSMLYAAGISGVSTPPLVRCTTYYRDLLPPTQFIISDSYDPVDATNVFVVTSVTTELI